MRRNTDRTVIIKKHRLVEQLSANREKHLKEYEEMLQEYHAAAILACEERLAAIKEDSGADLHIRLQPPTNHVSDYDRALMVLEYDTRDEHELTMDEFVMFIQDEWAWTSTFASNKAAYTMVINNAR